MDTFGEVLGWRALKALIQKPGQTMSLQDIADDMDLPPADAEHVLAGFIEMKYIKPLPPGKYAVTPQGVTAYRQGGLPQDSV